MSTVLSIELVSDGSNKLLARIDEDNVLIGRSPAPKGVALPSMAVSSTHGRFFRCGASWFYRDLNSTNGSWFGAKQLKSDYAHLVKNDDELRIANSIIKLGVNFSFDAEEFESFRKPHVYVFWHDQLVTILNITHHNQQFILGGDQSQVSLPEEFRRGNLLILRADGQECLFELHQANGETLHNDTQLNPPSKVTLSDRDNIVMGPLVMIYNSGYPDVETVQEDDLGTFIDPSASYTKKMITNSSFGKLPNENEEAELPQLKTATIANNVYFEEDESSIMADKIIYGIAFLALFSSVALLIWFLFSSS